MKTKMWDEFWIELTASDPSRRVTVGELLQMKERIKRRHLPEQVAEILEKANSRLISEAFRDVRDERLILEWVPDTIAKALRTGKLDKIEKWVKK